MDKHICSAWHFGLSNRTLSKIACALLMLLLVIGSPTFGARRFNTTYLSSMPKLGSLDSGSFVVELMHIHHMNSPYSKPNLTLLEKVHVLVKRNKERYKYLGERINGKGTTFGLEQHSFTTVHYGNNIYFMHILLGTPTPSLYNLDMDTGSNIIWTQCQPCQHCFYQFDPIFDPKTSKSYNSISYEDPWCRAIPVGPTIQTSRSASGGCLYGIIYEDNAKTKGSFGVDIFFFKGLDHSVEHHYNHTIAFGCGHNNWGQFGGSAGIVGMGRGALSLPSQMHKKVFSYCLVQFDSHESVTSPLLLGSQGPIPLKFTPFIINEFNRDHYYVHLESIIVNKEPVDFPPHSFDFGDKGQGGLMVDSGYTYSMFTKNVYTPLLKAIVSSTPYKLIADSASMEKKYGLDHCYDIKGETESKYPSVVFKFKDDLEMALPPENVFIEVVHGKVVCVALLEAEDEYMVFGSFQQQNFQVAYDIDGKGLGAARNQCSNYQDHHLQ